jgi:hypothetical protein
MVLLPPDRCFFLMNSNELLHLRLAIGDAKGSAAFKLCLLHLCCFQAMSSSFTCPHSRSTFLSRGRWGLVVGLWCGRVVERSAGCHQQFPTEKLEIFTCSAWDYCFEQFSLIKYFFIHNNLFFYNIVFISVESKNNIVNQTRESLY